MSKYILLFILFVTIASCSSVEKDAKANKSDTNRIEGLEKLAKEKYKNNFELVYNKNKDFVLCINKSKSNIPSPESINYFIYDLVNNKITYEGNIPKGSINWISDYEIRLKEIPGIVQRNGPVVNIYILNVETNLKTKLNSEVK